MTYIIAEAGTGYLSGKTGSEQIVVATEFMRAASAAGANACKFQMFIPNEPLFCPAPGDDQRFERWNRSMMDANDWRIVKEYAARYGLCDLLWSVFQPTCIEWLKELKPRYVKVASRAVNYFPYPAFADDVTFIVSGPYVPIHRKCERLKCIPEYPSPLKHGGFANSGCMYSGLSDHSGTIWPGLDAIYHRAKFLEVHFKVPGADMGNDEPVCLSVDQLKLLTGARDAVAVMHPHQG